MNERPDPDVLERDGEHWWWPSHKFDLSLDDLFTSLWDEYNTLAIPIQDRWAFHADVSELSKEAKTRDEFYSLLAQRREQRVVEVRACWKSTKLPYGSPLMGGDDNDDILEAYYHFSREWTIDAFVRYFWLFRDTYVSPPPSPGPASSTRSSKTTTPPTPFLSRKRKRSSSPATSVENKEKDGERGLPRKRRRSWVGIETPPAATTSLSSSPTSPGEIVTEIPQEGHAKNFALDTMARQQPTFDAGPSEVTCAQAQKEHAGNVAQDRSTGHNAAPAGDDGASPLMTEPPISWKRHGGEEKKGRSIADAWEDSGWKADPPLWDNATPPEDLFARPPKSQRAMDRATDHACQEEPTLHHRPQVGKYVDANNQGMDS